MGPEEGFSFSNSLEIHTLGTVKHLDYFNLHCE